MTTATISKSINHVAFTDRFEFFLSDDGCDLQRAPIASLVASNGCRLGAVIVISGISQTSDACVRITGRTPAQLGLVAHAAAIARINRWAMNEVGQPLFMSEENAGSRIGIPAHGFPITALIRWMGYNGFIVTEAQAALQDAGIAEPNINTIKTQLYHGRTRRAEGQNPKDIIDLPADLEARLMTFKKDKKRTPKVAA